MTIVLAGVTGLRNRGVEALVGAAIDGFSRHVPGETVTVLTTDPHYDRLALEGIADVAADAPHYFRSGRVERYLREMAAVVRSGRRLPPAIEILKSATAVVATGGDVFSSDYGMLRRLIGILDIAEGFRKPVIFLAHSIGPFKTRAEADAMRAVLDRAALVTVRESRTQKYLVDELRLPAQRIHLTADVAFLLKPAARTRVDALKRWLGLTGSPGYVALAPSEGITGFSSANDRQAHDRAWTRTVERILSTSADDVLLIPHVQDVRPSNDDRRIAARLLEAAGYNPRVRLAAGELSASDFKGLIQDSRYLVGERMHACIAALSSAVPTIAIGYSVKAQGIMEDLLGPDASTAGLHIPVAQFVGSDGLQTQVDRIRRNDGEIRRLLAAASTRAKQLADDNFDLVREALGDSVRAAA